MDLHADFVEEVLSTKLGEGLLGLEVHAVDERQWLNLYGILEPSEKHASGRQLLLFLVAQVLADASSQAG
jgi:hypothetical protein